MSSYLTRVLTWITTVTLIALLLLPNLIWLGHSQTLSTWLAALILPIALLTTLWALSGRRPWIACLILAPFALLAPLECFYVARYHVPSTATIIATLVASTPQETAQYLGPLLPYAIATPLLSLALALISARLVYRAQWHWTGIWRQRFGAIAILVAIPLVALSISSSLRLRGHPTVSHTTDFGQRFKYVGPSYPFGVLVRAERFTRQWINMRTDARQFAHFSFHAHRVEPQPHQRQVYVLVIGESSAREHWQLFGYGRPTNPLLSKQSDLIPIQHMVTSWPETIAAVPIMLTRKPITDNWPDWYEPSFLVAMQEAGFDTWWISNQYPIGRFDSPVAMYAYEAQHVIWVNHSTTEADPGAYDGALLPQLHKALKHSNRDLFIVLHMMGSHDTYDDRYPPQFKRFKPIMRDARGRRMPMKNIYDSYDNTIVYTDYILSQIIHTLQQSGAVSALWYESDHGELLPYGQCKRIGHGIGTWHEYAIPALFWYSSSYAQNFPRRVASLRANAAKRALSGDTFASVLSMAGVTFPGLDKTWSLFSPSWHYRKRIVGQFWFSNIDHAKLEKPCGMVKPLPDKN